MRNVPHPNVERLRYPFFFAGREPCVGVARCSFMDLVWRAHAAYAVERFGLPPRWLMAAEVPRLFGTIAALPFNAVRLAAAPIGDGSPIMVIPGCGATDLSTAVLRRYLSWLGYSVHGWGLGRNLGAKTVGQYNELLLDRVDRLNDATQRKLKIIGWSMGGIIARMIARQRQEEIEQLVLLGAPFTGNPRANRGWEYYERISGQSLSHPAAKAQIAESKLPSPVRSTSIYSKSDGIVAWRCCIEPASPNSRNIAVSSAHCAFAFHSLVLRIVADILAENQHERKLP
jgi:pimeloyl-ACP methyl ester carboxylesterase